MRSVNPSGDRAELIGAMPHAVFADCDWSVHRAGENQLYRDDFTNMKGCFGAADLKLKIDLRVNAFRCRWNARGLASPVHGATGGQHNSGHSTGAGTPQQMTDPISTE
jgi:hypothetical protein